MTSGTTWTLTEAAALGMAGESTVKFEGLVVFRFRGGEQGFNMGRVVAVRIVVEAPGVPALSSEPHAVSAIEPTRATLAIRPRRWIFTVFKPLHRGKSGAGVRARRHEGRQGG